MHQVKGRRQHDAARHRRGQPCCFGAHGTDEEEGQGAQACGNAGSERGDGLVKRWQVQLLAPKLLSHNNESRQQISPLHMSAPRCMVHTHLQLPP